jgi:pimeloyl-ACP methyl ester carboxylesterase
MVLAYADRFPEHVESLIVDGPVIPSAEGHQFSMGQARSFSLVFDRFVNYCEAPCPPGDKGVLDRQAARLESSPGVVVTRSVPVTETDLYLAIQWGLYDQNRWVPLRSALENDVSSIGQLSDHLTLRFGSTSYGPENLAYWSYVCADHRWPSPKEMFATWRSLAISDGLASSVYSINLPCAYWGGAQAERWKFPELNVPALVLSVEEDPATPIRWAEDIAESIPGSAFIRIEAIGHGSLGKGLSCADAAVSSFLRTGQVRESDRGGRCKTNERI